MIAVAPESLPLREQVCEFTVAELQLLSEQLAGLEGDPSQPPQTRERVLILRDIVEYELEERQSSQLIQFFEQGRAEDLRNRFMRNPFHDRIKAFNEKFQLYIERETVRPSQGKSFPLRNLRSCTDRQKQTLGNYMEKTLSKTKLTDYREVQQSQGLPRRKQDSKPILPKISEEVYHPVPKRHSPAKQSSKAIRVISKEQLVLKDQRPSAKPKQKARPAQQLASSRKIYSGKQHPQPQSGSKISTFHSADKLKVPPASKPVVAVLKKDISCDTEGLELFSGPVPGELGSSRCKQQVSSQSNADHSNYSAPQQEIVYEGTQNRSKDLWSEGERGCQFQINEFLQLQDEERQANEPEPQQQEQVREKESPAQVIQIKPQRVKLPAVQIIHREREQFRARAESTSVQKSEQTTSRDRQQSFKMFKVELERLPQSPGNPSKVLTSDSVSTLKEAGSVRKTTRKNTARPIPRAEQLLIRLAEALPDTLFDYSALFPSIQHLFTGRTRESFDLLEALRTARAVFDVHERTVDEMTVLRACRQMASVSRSSVEQYYSEDPEKVFMHAQATRIDIRKFVERQRIFVERVLNVPDKAPEQLLFFRAVRSKQEVYDIVGRTFMRRREWAELPHGLGLKPSWNLLWTWARPELDLNKLLVLQKVNHFPGNKHLARKDLLKKRIEGVQQLGPKARSEFDIIPKTFVLPKEYCEFVDAFLEGEREEVNLWIMKPVGKSRGRGITLVRELGQVLYSERVVIQQYIKNPLLLGGRKFDMRVYVLVTNMVPLEAFIYNEGFARFSTEDYTLENHTYSNPYVHLTNYAIQKSNSDPSSFGGPKTSFRTLEQRLAERGVGWAAVWSQVVDIVLKSLSASCGDIGNCPNAFQLFGYDIIIDSRLRCWLLEVNSSPSLERDFILDDLIKQQLLDDIIELLDPVPFDRARLVEVLERRVKELEGRKSNINTGNKSQQQLNRDLNYILHGRPLRPVGEMPAFLGGFQRIAPSEKSARLKRVIQNYKVSEK